MRRSVSFLVVVAMAGALGVTGAALPAIAAPRALQAVSGPAVYGFGTNQLGELGSGAQTATPSLSRRWRADRREPSGRWRPGCVPQARC